MNIDAELERLASRGNVEQVIEMFDLAQLAEFNPELGPKSLPSQLVARALSLIGRPGSEVEQDTVEPVLAAFYGALVVWKDEKSSALMVAFTSRDPELAEQIPNALIATYHRNREAQEHARMVAASMTLEDRVASQRKRVEVAREAVRQFQLEHRVAAADGVKSPAIIELEVVTERYAEVQRDLAELRAIIVAAESVTDRSAAPEQIETEALSELRTDLQEQVIDLARMQKTYGDSHAGVLALRERIAETQAVIDRSVASQVEMLRAQVRFLAREQADLAVKRDEAMNALFGVGTSAIELLSLVRTADVEADVLARLELQAADLAARTAIPALDLEVILPASRPLWPLGYGRKTYLIIATLAGLCIALTVAGLRELLDRTVRSHNQLEAARSVAPVGMLPAVPRRRAYDLTDLIQRRPDNHLAGALRGAVLGMEIANGGTLPNSLTVCPVHASDGEHFVARALALELVTAGRHVLLVEPRIAGPGWFRAPDPRPGLAEFLRGDADFDALVRREQATGLHILSRGRGRLPPLHDRTPVERILAQAHSRDLTVVFDAPPVLASASTLQIACATERTLLVLRWGRTKREHADLAVRRLRSSGVEMPFTLIDRVNGRRQALYGFRDAAAFADAGPANVW